MVVTEEFLEKFRPLTWRELLVGVREGWLDPSVVSTIAAHRVAQGSADRDAIELAGLTLSELSDVPSLLQRLADCEEETELEARRTWFRLLLTWVHEHQHDFADPLGVVEQIYADFDYPEEIRHLIRYNPPSPGETAVGNEGIKAAWQEYVEWVKTAL